ncbi:MAG: 4-hydroxy-2-oxovalerate aldolase [Planctomycetes bacterium]|nr:4-hydroxy-2-oxovalerate aldolase [Planctomycetota bacterium]
MRNSKTLARIRNHQTVRMCCLGHYIPFYVKHAAHCGFDCIWLDLEHRNWSERDVQALLTQSHLHDIDIMVRPATIEKTGLYRYLEDGAAGLMIPHVNTAERAQSLVQAVKYPPLGDRGLDGAGLDADYYLSETGAFIKHANHETFLVVQIETPQAVQNADEIAAVAGVDGIFIGPGDLGLRLNLDPSNLPLESAIEHVASACQRHGKAWGMPVGTPELLKKRQNQGGQLLNHGGEFGAIMTMLQTCGAAFADSAEEPRP